MRYVMRIAISSESSKLWTQLALLRKYVCWSVCLSPPQNHVCLWSRRSLSFPFGFETDQLRWNVLTRQLARMNKTDLAFFLWRSDATSTWLSCHYALETILQENDGYPFGSPIRQEYPLNLSILLRGGKETNKDSLSKGDWSGKSSDWKSSEL